MNKSFVAKTLSTAVLAALSFGASADGLSFNIGVVSLYKSSGNDQDDRQADPATAKSFRPALQGGVDYSFGNGFYVGNWNSTGKFGGGDGLEIDLYAGYGGDISKDLSYDLNLTTYVYPGAADGYDGTEFAAKLSYKFASIKYVYGLDEYTNKWVLGAKLPVTDKIALSADYHIRNNNAGESLVVGASYDLGDSLSASATVSGTSGNAPAGKTRLVLGLTKGF